MRIGVFGNHDSWYVNELLRVGTARGHVDAAIVVRAVCRSGSVLGTSNSCAARSISRSLDVVLVRTMPPGSLEQVVARMDMLAGLEAGGVRIINPPRALECAVDKYLTTQRLAAGWDPVPATIVCENSDAALEAFEVLGRDVVIKPLFGAEGRGIMRVSDPELAMRAFQDARTPWRRTLSPEVYCRTGL